MAKQDPIVTAKEYAVEIVKTEKPETTAQLVKLLQDKYSLSEEKITGLLLELEAEKKLNFTLKPPNQPMSTQKYVFSRQTVWYWLTVVVAIATVLAVLMIPDSNYPLVYVRSALGVLFVLLLPGFALMNILYPLSPSKITTVRVNRIERVALSIGTSIALTSLVGLILNYTPWEIRLIPATLCLSILTLVLATLALLRQQKTRTQIN